MESFYSMDASGSTTVSFNNIHVESDEIKKRKFAGYKSDSVVSQPVITQHECVKNALAIYLKRRNYRFTESNGELAVMQQLVENADEMHERKSIEGESLNHNTILYSSMYTRSSMLDSQQMLDQVEQQFDKLLTFINNLNPEAIKQELSKVMPLVFCHVYLEILKGVNRESALEFFDRYSDSVVNQKDILENDFSMSFINRNLNDEFMGFEAFHNNGFQQTKNWVQELVIQLKQLTSVQYVKSVPLIASFRSMKRQVNLSPDAATALRRFFSKCGHSVILHIFNKWFEYEIQPAKDSNNSEENLFDSYSTECYDFKDIDDLDRKILSNDRGFDSQEEINMKIDKTECSSETGEAEYIVKTPRSELDELSQVLERCQHVEFTKITKLFAAHGVSCAVTDHKSLSNAVGRNNSSILLCKKQNPWMTTQELQDVQHSFGDAWLDFGSKYLYGHSGGVTDLKFTSDGALLLSSSSDHTMKLWRMGDGECVNLYSGHQAPIWCLDICPNDKYIVTGSHDNSARLWAIDRKYPFRIFAGSRQDIECLKFHHNGSYIATGSKDRMVRLYSISDGRIVRMYHETTGLISTIAFSPDGKYIAGGGEDKLIYIWDLAHGRKIAELPGHAGHVMSIAWDPRRSSDVLLTGSLSGELKQWTKTGNTWDVTNLSPEGVYRRVVKVEYIPQDGDWTAHAYVETTFQESYDIDPFSEVN